MSDGRDLPAMDIKELEAECRRVSIALTEWATQLVEKITPIVEKMVEVAEEFYISFDDDNDNAG